MPAISATSGWIATISMVMVGLSVGDYAKETRGMRREFHDPDAETKGWTRF
jgi:hypothetical protein